MSNADGLFDALAEATSDGVIVVDEAGCVRYINARAAALLDRAREALPGLPLGELGLRPGTGVQFVGEWALNVQAIETPGARLLLLRPAEESDLESQRIHLIERIQHMLRNQLAAVSGFLDLIMLDALNPDDADLVVRAQSTADRLNEALPRLLDIAWLDTGTGLKREPLDLAEVVRRAAAGLRGEAETLQIALETELPAGLPLVQGSAERLTQAISEMLRNALVYSLPGGRVWVRVRADEAGVSCEVQDEGIGISEDDQAMVFDRLFRSKDPRVRAIPGHGLGLTLARRIARVHEATLSVSSAPGAGSTFTLRIPHG